MKRKLIISLVFVLMLGAVVLAQDDFDAEKKQAWKEFDKKSWDKFDFAKKKITKVQIGKLKSDGVVDELALLRHDLQRLAYRGQGAASSPWWKITRAPATHTPSCPDSIDCRRWTAVVRAIVIHGRRETHPRRPHGAKCGDERG